MRMSKTNQIIENLNMHYISKPFGKIWIIRSILMLHLYKSKSLLKNRCLSFNRVILFSK
jgi:hypothetical protein